MGILRRLSRWAGSTERMQTLNPGQTAPDFKLRSLDGKEYSLKSLLERGPVIAAFFKISCPVCQYTFPFLERMYQRYGRGDVTFIGISQDNARASKEFADQFGVTFPVVMDADGYPASNAYGLTNVPTTFFIDPNGKTKLVCHGFTKKDLEAMAAEMSQRENLPLQPLFRADEHVPANRPG